MAEQHGALDGLDGVELLRIASETLMEQVGPAVPGDRRYELLMANNAIGIASRELEAGEGPGRAALARLEALYGESPTDDDWRDRLSELTARFAADIRSGAFDEGPRRDTALAHVREATLDAVRVGNPRYLQRRGIE